MTEPTVAAIMLTRDRPELARKAVECFKTQTYERKMMVIWDSGDVALDMDAVENYPFQIWCRTEVGRGPIGKLRNDAATWICDGPTSITDPTIFVHWDDDDYSHPNRISEQVALLQASGADVVGYNDMLFWRYCRGFATPAQKVASRL
jgi:hypothetical protein